MIDENGDGDGDDGQIDGLDDVRRDIEEIDHDILDNIAERTRLGRHVAEMKDEKNMQIDDEGREREIIETARERAKERDLDPDLVEEIYEILIELNKQRQRRHL